jgi:amino acid transporter/mannitol/fructose-specific phosphotransferase system IIA component (Ntr-type)
MPGLVAKLERQLGLLSVVAIALSTMLGAGVFVLPLLAAAKTGPSVYLAYMAAGVVVVPAALAEAELATGIASSGGSYAFLDRTFGPMVGTIAGIGLWLSLLFKSGLALLGVGIYLRALAEIPILASAGAVLALIVLSNVRGLLRLGQLQVAAVIFAAVALLAVAVFGVIERDPARMTPLFPEGAEGFIAAAAFLVVSYLGVTKVAGLAGEIQRPERTLPLGMLIAVVLASALYAGVAYAVVSVTDVAALDERSVTRPLHALADVTAGSTFAIVIAAIAVVTLASTANAGLLAAARYPFAMSRDDLLPPALSQLHKRFVSPVAAIAITGLAVAAAVIVLDIGRLAELDSAMALVLFALVNLAILVLREAKPAWYQPRYRAPLYPWLQVGGIIVCVGFMVVLGSTSLVALAVMGGPGVGVYLLFGRKRSGRRGVVGIRGPRRDLLRQVPEPEPVQTHDSEVVVALLGEERTPELLVEHAAALARGGMVKVAALVEIPEQTFVEDMPDDPLRDSVERRVQAAAEANNLDLRFETILSRDVIRTVHDLSKAEKCRWLVMEWAGRSRGTFTISNPLGWLKEHLPCNLFSFHDAGVRYIRRILVLAEPGPHDALVTTTADELAQVHDAQLILARFVSEDASEAEVESEIDYLKEMVSMCRSEPEHQLIQGGDQLTALVRESATCDLMVLGEDGRASLLSKLFGTKRDRLTAEAACSVVRLQTARHQIHRAVEDEPEKRPAMTPLSDMLLDSCVAVGLSGSKRELFDTIAARFAATVDADIADEISRAMNDRERSQNTAIGRGVALPHATLSSVERTYLGVFVAAEAIDYGAPDGAGVDVFFVTIGPPWERQVHLGLLALIARLAKQTSLLEGLRGAWDADEAQAALETAAAELDV